MTISKDECYRNSVITSLENGSMMTSSVILRLAVFVIFYGVAHRQSSRCPSGDRWISI